MFGQVPLSSFFIKTHVFQELFVLYADCYSTFFFAFLILNFLWQVKDLLLLMNYIRGIFCSLHLTKSDPAIWRAREFQVRFLFPSARNSKGKTDSLWPSLRSILGPGWVKKQSCDWIHHLYPVSPLVVLDATFSPTTQAVASHFYRQPLIPP